MGIASQHQAVVGIVVIAFKKGMDACCLDNGRALACMKSVSYTTYPAIGISSLEYAFGGGLGL